MFREENRLAVKLSLELSKKKRLKQCLKVPSELHLHVSGAAIDGDSRAAAKMRARTPAAPGERCLDE